LGVIRAMEGMIPRFHREDAARQRRRRARQNRCRSNRRMGD
jgi:hypothetical protein